MSTIASPRDTSVPGSRRIPLISTPTSSSRPSLEQTTRSTEASPSRLSTSTFPPTSSTLPKRNRAALREYYNLKAATSTSSPNPNASNPPPPSDSSDTASIHDYPTTSSPASELDSADFNADEYVKRVLEEQSLTELLATYNRVLGDIRALDAERKALVYDNYSKLIVATETIGRMRGAMEREGRGVGMGQGSGKGKVGDGLDERVEEVWRRAEAVRGVLARTTGVDGEREERRRKTRSAAERVLGCPERVRELVRDGKVDEARSLWADTRTLLERWKERGVGGSDVLDCIEDGEAALRGEPAGDKSWVKLKETREIRAKP